MNWHLTRARHEQNRARLTRMQSLGLKLCLPVLVLAGALGVWILVCVERKLVNSIFAALLMSRVSPGNLLAERDLPLTTNDAPTPRRMGIVPVCGCGRAISANKSKCLACSLKVSK